MSEELTETAAPPRVMRMELGPRGTAYVEDSGDCITLRIVPDSGGGLFEERLGWLDAAVGTFVERYRKAGSLEWLLAHEAHPVYEADQKGVK